jgi:hypothetical protein
MGVTRAGPGTLVVRGRDRHMGAAYWCQNFRLLHSTVIGPFPVDVA